jgi:hypothetical protein
MLLWIFKTVGWKFAVAGAAAALVSERVARPLAVKTVRGGLAARAGAGRIMADAKTELDRIAEEAKTGYAEVEDASSEVQRLRREVAELKASLGASRGAQ